MAKVLAVLVLFCSLTSGISKIALGSITRSFIPVQIDGESNVNETLIYAVDGQTNQVYHLSGKINWGAFENFLNQFIQRQDNGFVVFDYIEMNWEELGQNLMQWQDQLNVEVTVGPIPQNSQLLRGSSSHQGNNKSWLWVPAVGVVALATLAPVGWLREQATGFGLNETISLSEGANGDTASENQLFRPSGRGSIIEGNFGLLSSQQLKSLQTESAEFALAVRNLNDLTLGAVNQTDFLQAETTKSEAGKIADTLKRLSSSQSQQPAYHLAMATAEFLHNGNQQGLIAIAQGNSVGENAAIQGEALYLLGLEDPQHWQVLFTNHENHYRVAHAAYALIDAGQTFNGYTTNQLVQLFARRGGHTFHNGHYYLHSYQTLVGIIDKHSAGFDDQTKRIVGDAIWVSERFHRGTEPYSQNQIIKLYEGLANKTPQEWYRLGLSYHNNVDAELKTKAINAYNSGRKSPPSQYGERYQKEAIFQSHLRLAELYESQEKDDLAIEVLQEVDELFASVREFDFYLAQAMHHRARLAGNEQLKNEVLQKYPNSHAAAEIRKEQVEAESDVAQAVALLNEMFKLHPQEPATMEAAAIMVKRLSESQRLTLQQMMLNTQPFSNESAFQYVALRGRQLPFGDEKKTREQRLAEVRSYVNMDRVLLDRSPDLPANIENIAVFYPHLGMSMYLEYLGEGIKDMSPIQTATLASLKAQLGNYFQAELGLRSVSWAMFASEYKDESLVLFNDLLYWRQRFYLPHLDLALEWADRLDRSHYAATVVSYPESLGETTVVSYAGAKGILQICGPKCDSDNIAALESKHGPLLTEVFGPNGDPDDYRRLFGLGFIYLDGVLDRNGPNMAITGAEYNAGGGRVEDWGLQPSWSYDDILTAVPIEYSNGQTYNYVRRIVGAEGAQTLLYLPTADLSGIDHPAILEINKYN